MCQSFWVFFFLLSFTLLSTWLHEFGPTCISFAQNLCILLTFWERNIPFYCHIVIYYCDIVIGLNLWKCFKGDIWEMDVVLEVPFPLCPEAMPVWPFIHLSVPSWRCSALPFLIIHPQIWREGLRCFHSFLCRSVSSNWSDMQSLSVRAKCH